MKIKPMMVLPPLLFAALAAMFLWGMNREDPNALPSTREGGPVPAVTLSSYGGTPPFTDADLASGDVVLVNFFASWCVSCRAEHEQIKTLARDGVTVFGIDYKDTPDKAARYLAQLGNPYTRIAADDTGRTGLDWGLYGVPETFIIDGNGIIVKRFAGPITPEALDKVIRPAIEKARAQSN